MAIAEQSVINEHELYPVHEEDTVPEKPAHEYQSRYLRDALSARLPQHWVTGEMCMYWIPGDKQHYVAPDVLVLEGPRESHPHDVYLAWSDGTPLLVIEVGSRSTLVSDEGPKVERYLLDLRVRGYVFYDPPHRRLRMWRLVDGAAVEIAVNESGRVYSPELDLEFGPDAEGFLRIYERDGRMLLTHEEQCEQTALERQRAESLEQEVERLREELRRRNGPFPPA